VLCARAQIFNETVRFASQTFILSILEPFRKEDEAREGGICIQLNPTHHKGDSCLDIIHAQWSERLNIEIV